MSGVGGLRDAIRANGGSRLPRDVLLGLLLGLAVLLGSAVLVLDSPPRYRADASLLVQPDEGLPPDLVAGYYDTLSQGQVVGTLAEVLRVRAAADGTATGPGGAAVSVQVVPETAVIQVTGSARTGAAAGRAADRLVEATTPYLAQAYAPYRVNVVHRADGTARRVGLGRLPLSAVALLVSAVAGLAGQQASRQILLARRRPPAGVPVALASPPGQAVGDRAQDPVSPYGG